MSENEQNQQQWLLNVIPSEWADKPWLINELNFAILKHFMEEENPAKLINWESDAGHKEAWRHLNIAYMAITQTLPRLNTKLERLTENISKETLPLITDLESKIFNLETAVLQIIVANRKYMWV